MTIVVKTHSQLRKVLSGKKNIGFVPTMGALHQGHLSLVQIAQRNSDIVVVSIFVNPTQFSASEDLDKYPRTEENDIAMLSSIGTDYVYIPTKEEIYPEVNPLPIDMGEIGQIFEGKFRPHFFAGVALVVSRLFSHVLPNIAVFGEKDYQQLIIIKQLVTKLNLPIKIISGAIIREQDGLAMSSRNRYLNQQQRMIAKQLYQTLQYANDEINSQQGETLAQIINNCSTKLLNSGFDQIDYFSVVNNDNLEIIDNINDALTKNSRILAAARLGTTRLLDNLLI